MQIAPNDFMQRNEYLLIWCIIALQWHPLFQIFGNFDASIHRFVMSCAAQMKNQ